MNQQQINLFFDDLKLCWSKQNEETIKAGKHLMEKMLKSEDLKKYLTNESDNLAKGIELYRDSEFGFILLAYSETKGLYRMPHNHGNGWVIYSVVEGIIEMGTYALIGDMNLIKKEKHQVQIGNSEVYFPGDIHDTQCVSDSVIILRLTSCDLKEEERQGRMKKFQKSCSLKT